MICKSSGKQVTDLDDDLDRCESGKSTATDRNCRPPEEIQSASRLSPQNDRPWKTAEIRSDSAQSDSARSRQIDLDPEEHTGIQTSILLEARIDLDRFGNDLRGDLAWRGCSIIN